MKNKNYYDPCEIEIINFNERDVIATSSIEGEDSDITEGWT